MTKKESKKNSKKLSNNKNNKKIDKKIRKYRSKVKRYSQIKNTEGGFKFRLGDRFRTPFGDTGTILREAEQDEFGIDLPTWISPYYVVQFNGSNSKPYNGVINKMINGQYVYIAAETNLIPVNEFNLSMASINLNPSIISSWMMNEDSDGSRLLFDYVRRNYNSISSEAKGQLSYIANYFLQQETNYKEEIEELRKKNKKQKKRIIELENELEKNKNIKNN